MTLTVYEIDSILLTRKIDWRQRMNIGERLNRYLARIGCTAKEA